MTPICPECDHEMTDENEGYSRLRFGSPSRVCKNAECPRYCDNIEVAADETALPAVSLENIQS